MTRTLPFTLLSLTAAAALLAACGGGGGDADTPLAEETRLHDSRNQFEPVAANNTQVYPDYEAAADGSHSFKAMPGVSNATRRWTGVLNGSSYRIEVPENWNGKLVMWAHGYSGTGNALIVQTPTALRSYLIDNGYAWAASSYSKNYYDVRAGVEDTNALALAFTKIAAAKGHPLNPPSRIYIAGRSMGGHITAAAIEAETAAHAKNKVRYDGALPLCGVTGDTELFDYFNSYQALAQYYAGVPQYPFTSWSDIDERVRSALFHGFTKTNPSGMQPTAQGEKLRETVKYITGGERPIFAQGFANVGLQNVVWGTFGSDGTINGILNKSVADTQRFVYQLDRDAALSEEETKLNQTVLRRKAEADANRLRRDGLRWVPKVNGEFNVPVVSLHTLGDMYVPFHMMQIHRQRAIAKGNSERLVTRAIRAPGHCDFTWAEQVRGFADLVQWVEKGQKPAGDDVLNPDTVAHEKFGCAFTVNTASQGEPSSSGPVATRSLMPSCSGT